MVHGESVAIANPESPVIAVPQEGIVARLRAKTLMVVLLSAAALLVAGNLALGVTQMLAGRGIVADVPLLRLIDLDAEQSLGTWFSVMLLGTAALLLALTSYLARRRGDPLSHYWVGLSALFVLLSIDEACSVHEMAIAPMSELVGRVGIFYFAWTIPALVLVVVLAIAFRRFVVALPPRMRFLFLLAGVIYVGGALGMEMVGGLLQTMTSPGVVTGLTTTVEEMMEMAGIVVFIYALLENVRSTFGRITLSLE